MEFPVRPWPVPVRVAVWVTGQAAGWVRALEVWIAVQLPLSGATITCSPGVIGDCDAKVAYQR